MKNDEIRAFFEPQILIEQPNMFRGQNFRDFSKKISLENLFYMLETWFWTRFKDCAS